MKKGEDTKLRILKFIEEYHNEHKYMPSYREIMDGTGLKSISSVNHYMSRIFALGILETDAIEGSPRAYRFRKEFENG